MFGFDENDGLLYSADGEPAGAVATFSTKRELAALCEEKDWSKAKVTEIWNANARLLDQPKVKRFRNRPYGVQRLWEAAQKLAKPTDEPPSNGKVRDGSKAATALELMKRDGGASGAELQLALGWLPHTVRGFVSTLRSKHGVEIKAEKIEGRGKVYTA